MTIFTITPIHFFFIGLSAFICLYAALLAAKTSAGMKISVRREVIKLIFIVYMLCVLSVTLFPVKYDVSLLGPVWSTARINIVPFLTIVQTFEVFGIERFSVFFKLKTVLLDIGGKLLLLFPLGFILPQMNKRFHKTAPCFFIILMVSCGIELIQFIEASFGLLTGHSPNIDDVLLNVSGGLCGFNFWLSMRIKFYEDTSKTNTKIDYK